MAVPLQSEYSVLFLNSTLRNGGIASDPRLRELNDRDTISLSSVAAKPIANPLEEARRPDVYGVVVSMSTGLPDLDQLRFAECVLSCRSKIWFYWPGETAIESIDREKIKSYQRHFMAAKVWETVRPAARVAYAVATKIIRAAGPVVADQAVKNCNAELEQIIAKAKPVELQIPFTPSLTNPLPGVGFYLRTDYWAPMTSGGSYGHTCYVARSLARTVDDLICLTPSHYPLLVELGLNEMVMPAPGVYTGEKDLLLANRHYYALLRGAIEIVKPQFIYERLCLGNYCAARASQEFGIPYILEYNGSEIEMSRTFAQHRFQHEKLFIKAEEAAFHQATVISVVSEALKDELVARGVPSERILVNPNAVDPDAYAPPSQTERLNVRRDIGFGESDTVIGFTGTFGGWHGIDVLAEAFPQICKSNPSARLLLVGDGSYKHLIDSAVRQHRLEDRVISLGRVPQQEGARLLRACDIYVSPHSRTMSSGRFFGSPTKLFEYMAMGRGIVASDLDQIGEMLSPALRAPDLNGSKTTVGAERAVLCRPGDVAEFVRAVEYLIRNPETAAALGQNARQTIVANHTWDSHIQQMWRFSTRYRRPGAVPVSSPRSKEQGPFYRREFENIWNYGSVRHDKAAKPHSLDWYLEVEADHRTGAPLLAGIDVKAYAGKKVLEIGTGIGTDLIQFAKHGADVTYLNSSALNLELAKENFRLRNLNCHFVYDTGAESALERNTFDLVYCSEFSIVADPRDLVSRIFKLLRPGGRVLALAVAENSYHHWFVQFFRIGLLSGLLSQFSMVEIVSRDYATGNEKQIVRNYTREGLRGLFTAFDDLRLQHPHAFGKHLLVRATRK